MKYKTFTETDFAADENFIQWVKEPNPNISAFWENWLAQNPGKQEVVNNARKLINKLSQDQEHIAQWELDLIWENIRLAKQNAPQNFRFKNLLSYPHRRVAIAATFIVLLIAGAILYKFSKPEITEYVTSFGEKRTIRLPDNSLVVLNGNSKLIVPGSWQANEPRRVRLEGEAYFVVTHQKNNQKFIVSAAEKLQVEVLGTEFNVSTRDLVNQVVLKSGKVRLHIDKGTKTEQIEMQPGELVQVSEKTKRIVEKVVRPEIYTAWKENKLIFDNTSMKEVAAILKNTYGHTVKFEDESLQRLGITASLDAKNIDTVLTTIAETLSIKIDKKNDNIIIDKL